MRLLDAEQLSAHIDHDVEAFVCRHAVMCPLEPFPKNLGERLAKHYFFATEVVVDGRGRDLGVSHKLLDRRVWADFRENVLG
jgi:hypothetical protein